MSDSRRGKRTVAYLIDRGRLERITVEDPAGQVAVTAATGGAVYDSNIIWEGFDVPDATLTCSVTDGTHTVSGTYTMNT